MTRVVVGAVLSIAIAVGLISPSAGALSLKIAPLEYTAELKKGDVKKGYIDISNPDAKSAKVALSVQAFRQTDDQGSLEFYGSEQLRLGVKLDFETITLGAGEGMRVFFLLDGTKLPSGDVFGAIMASTIPDENGGGSAQSVQVGTLLMLRNGTPVGHTAKIDSLSAHWLQIGEAINARFTVTNPESEKKSTGFSPQITVALRPYQVKGVQGPLLFAGRTRAVDYRQTGDYFGPMLLDVSYENSHQTKLMFVITGYWRWVAPLVAATALVIGWFALRRSKTTTIQSKKTPLLHRKKH